MFKLSFSSWSLSAHRASTKLAESFLSLRACASIQSVGRTRLGASWWLCRISLELFSVLMYWESDSSPLMYLYAYKCKIDCLIAQNLPLLQTPNNVLLDYPYTSEVAPFITLCTALIFWERLPVIVYS